MLYAPKVIDRSDGGTRTALAIHQPSIFRSRVVEELEPHVCKRCGFVEWYVKDVAALEPDGKAICEIDGSRGPSGDGYR